MKWDDTVSFTVLCNNPKFSDRQVWANSGDPDQTVPSGAVLYAHFV